MRTESSSPRRSARLLTLFAPICLVALGAFSTLFGQQQQRKEDATDHYSKWLKEDVVYIIAPEEADVFDNLATDEERDQFIEQFWFRRDPDSRTEANEYKAEHYRRIAYANERFSAGFPGWRTDRGKTYIVHGPPNELQEFPSGGTYDRPLNEGGGQTATYPFEIWRYRHIEGVGTNIELQFVDRANSNEYRLALTPDEKDAFLHVPTAGYTLAEQLGLATRLQRPYFSPGNTYPLMNYREQDSAFQRYQRFVDVQRPPTIRYKDLKQIVQVDVSYDSLPFQSRTDYFRLDEDSVLVPITVQVPHAELTLEKGVGAYTGKVALYGLVTGIDNRVAAEFEDEVVASISPDEVARGVGGSSLYQKTIILDPKKKYKLDLVLKDLNDGSIGASSQAILPPGFEGDGLSISSLILSDYVAPAGEAADVGKMFLLGDVIVRPKLDRSFERSAYFAIYTQLHNVSVDQSSQRPYFRINYRIRRDGVTRIEESDATGASVQYFSTNRMVLIKRLALADLAPGRYQVEVEFVDKIKGEKISARDSFRIVGP